MASNKYEIEYNNIEYVEIKGEMFNVEIIGESRNNISGFFETSDNNHKLFFNQHGNILEIIYKRPLLKLPIFKTHNLFLKVPVLTNIKIDNSSGKVNINSIMTNEIKINTSSGNVLLSNINAKIDVKTSSGNITSSKIVSKYPVLLKSSSGIIIMEDSNTDLEVNSTSGRQFFKNNKGNINTNTSSGNIDIENQEGVFKIKTSSGKISGRNIKVNGDSVFNTTSGDILFVFNNLRDELTFDLKASSGKLEVETQKDNKELIYGKGKIKITGKSSSGSQIYNFK